MANLIDFRFLDNNEDTIVGLDVNYSVQTVAVQSNNRRTEGLPEPRGPIYFSEMLLEGTETTDGNGYITVDVTNMFTDPQFISIFTKFGNLKEYNVSIFITLMNEKQEIGSYVYLGQTETPKELLAYNVYKVGPTTYRYDDLDYSDVYSNFIIDEVVVNETKLKEYQAEKNKKQKQYIEELTSFQGEIQSQGILQIPTLNRYNPINITQVITRCLELNVGCLDNALVFSRDTGLIGETNRLASIRNLIEQISDLYPEISIEQGEGLPYQNIGVIPTPFRGYSFYLDEGIINFKGYLMNPFIVKKGDENFNPSISLNGEIMEFAEFGGVNSPYYEGVQTAGINASFKFDDIENIVLNYQGKSKLPQVGLVPGDVLSVTSYVEYNGDLQVCVEGEVCKAIAGGQYTTSIVIK